MLSMRQPGNDINVLSQSLEDVEENSVAEDNSSLKTSHNKSIGAASWSTLVIFFPSSTHEKLFLWPLEINFASKQSFSSPLLPSLGTWLGLEGSFGDIFHRGGKSMLYAQVPPILGKLKSSVSIGLAAANQHCFRILER